jgi:DNA-binding GntR family transcriptional regulator
MVRTPRPFCTDLNAAVTALTRRLYALLGVPEAAAATMEREFAAMQAAAQARDFQAVAVHNKNFHCHIVRGCANQELVRVWKSLGVGLRSRLNIQRLAEAGHLMEAVDSHRAVLNALYAGDLRRAGDLLREHANAFVMEDISAPARRTSRDVRQ